MVERFARSSAGGHASRPAAATAPDIRMAAVAYRVGHSGHTSLFKKQMHTLGNMYQRHRNVYTLLCKTVVKCRPTLVSTFTPPPSPRFYMHSADYAIARCLSVCLSVKRRYSVETTKRFTIG